MNILQTYMQFIKQKLHYSSYGEYILYDFSHLKISIHHISVYRTNLWDFWGMADNTPWLNNYSGGRIEQPHTLLPPLLPPRQKRGRLKTQHWWLGLN